MKKLITMLLVIFSLFLFLGCDNAALEVGNEEAKTSGSIDITIKDINTLMGIDSAKISWTLNGTNDSRFTDSLGNATISGFPRGVYLFKIEKDGYASVQSYVVDFYSTGENAMPVLGDYDTTLLLHPKTISIQGIVKKQDTEGNITPQAGVIVDLQLDKAYGFEQISLIDTTDANGSYQFDSIPEQSFTYSVSTRTFQVAGYPYQRVTLTQLMGLKSGEIVVMEPAIAGIDANPFQVDSYTREIGTSDTLSIIFSDTIDITKIRKGDIIVQNGMPTTIAADYSFNVDNKTLKLFPAKATWGERGDYSFTVNLTSLTGNTLNAPYTFSVLDLATATPASSLIAFQAADTLIDYNTPSLNLLWPQVANAAGYDIFLKQKDEDNFVKYQNVANGTDTLVNVTGLDYTAGNDNTFMVVSYTANGTSLYENAPTLYTKDVTPPTANNATLAVYNNLDNSAGLTTDTLQTEVITVTADIDTATAPTISFLTNTTLFGVDWNWTAGGDISANIVVKIIDASAIVSDTILITGLKDLAGNTSSDTVRIPLTFGDLTVAGFAATNANLIDYNTNTVDLSWTATSGATGYEIHVKASGGNYTQVQTIPNGATTTATLTTTGDFANGQIDSVKIVSVTATETAPLAIATALELKDVFVPTVTPTSVAVINDLDNSAGGTAKTVSTAATQTTFADVNSAATITTVFQTNPTLLGVINSWTGTTLNLTATVLANQNAVAVTADTILVSGLVDLAGNAAPTLKVPVTFSDLTASGFSALNSATMDYNTTTASLDWTANASATGYQVHYKLSGDVNYTNIDVGNVTAYTLNPPLDFTTGNVYNVKLVSYAGGTVSDIANAPGITLQDVIAPTMAGPSLAYIYDELNNVGSGGSAKALIVAQAIATFADIDNTATLTATLKNNPTLLSSTATFAGNNISLNVSVIDEQDASAVTIDTVVITGLQDVSGNAVAASYEIPLSLAQTSDQSFDAAGLAGLPTGWTGGTGDWELVTAQQQDGARSLKSKTGLLDTETSSLEVSVYVPADKTTISFWRRVDSDGTDALNFYIDNALQTSGWTGVLTTWVNSTFTVTGGATYTLRWDYVKDGAGAGAGDDAAWVDHFTIQ